MKDRLLAAGALFAGLALAFIGSYPPDVIALAPPVSAFGLMGAFLLSFPGFLGPRLRYPHAIVLPLAFGGLTLAVGTFWDIREVSIVASGARLATAQFWLTPIMLAKTFAWQAVCIGIAIPRRKSDFHDPSAPSAP
ncbi:hypothetical protein EON81_17080 [bacterium]|nr:MAG: hypothetical protein EON81_17080 [bacterium]